MTASRDGWGRWYRTIAVAMVIVPIPGLLAPAAETKKAAARAENKVQKAREVLASLKTLDLAVKKEKNPETPSKTKLPPRPEKVVTKPSLTPEGLDALIDKQLAEAK